MTTKIEKGELMKVEHQLFETMLNSKDISKKLFLITLKSPTIL